ncbi:MAG: hypothetical protein ACYC4R_16490 [Anaerolineae bacterium]
MTWAPLLLADPSPCLRWLVLRELLGRPADDPEVRELEGLRLRDPLVTELLLLQQEDGAWAGAEPITATLRALTRLGYLGFGPELAAVRRGADYLFARQRPDGAWPLRVLPEASEERGYTMIPLQTALPLRSLAVCGYAEDPRAAHAYDWLLAQRLDDGAWPTGINAGVYGGVGGYRRLAHSRWGCRSNTTGALLCLAHHPQRRRSPEALRGLDLLLGRETREREAVGFEVARIVGAEPSRGFLTHFARFDVGLVLDLCGRVGIGTEDARVADALAFVRSLQGLYGLWEYAARPQVGRWVTFDLLRALARLDQATDWLSLEPRTPFRPYLHRLRRY